MVRLSNRSEHDQPGHEQIPGMEKAHLVLSSSLLIRDALEGSLSSIRDVRQGQTAADFAGQMAHRSRSCARSSAGALCHGAPRQTALAA